MPEINVPIVQSAATITSLANISIIGGAFFVVADISARDNLEASRLELNQIVYVQDESKLYQVTTYALNFFTDSFDVAWTEFTGFGSTNPEGVPDPLSIGSITINPGGAGPTFSHQEGNTINITANDTTNILNIESGSSTLGLNINGKGLLELDAFDYTPTVNNGNILFSGSAYYVGIPELPNEFNEVWSIQNAPSSEEPSFFLSLVPTSVSINSTSTVSGATHQIYHSPISMYKGQIFTLSFNVTTAPLIGTTSINIHPISIFVPPVQIITNQLTAGVKSITFSSQVEGNAVISITTTSLGNSTSYTFSDLKLEKKSI